MQSAQSNKKTRYLLFVSIILAALIILGGAAYAVIGLAGRDGSNGNGTANESAAKSGDRTVTQQTLTKSLGEVNESVEQSKEAHAAASAAINDPAKRVKVSN